MFAPLNNTTMKKLKQTTQMNTKIKKGRTVIVTEYYSGLCSYLDEVDIKWAREYIDNVGDFIKIYFDKQLSSSDIFGFAMDFAAYRDVINN